MFDIGLSELFVIGVVALIVIGPERLPKVARTAGHLYGRMQRYVSSVKSDISQEIQLDEIRRAGQEFKNSVESTVSGVEQQATVVDDFLRNEADSLGKTIAEGARPVIEAKAEQSPQQSLLLDEPDQNRGARTSSAVPETARGGNPEKTA